MERSTHQCPQVRPTLGDFSVLLTTLFALYSSSAFPQAEKNIESRITGVTVFLSKAQVTRIAKTRIESGKSSLVLSGLTSLLDPSSIQASGKGNFVILGISHRQNFLDEQNLPKEVKLLRDSLEYYQRQLILVQSQKEILNREEQMLLSNQKIGGTSQNLTVAELKGMADFYRSRLGDIVSSRMREDEKIKKINTRVAKLQAQIAEHHDARSRNTSEIVIHVSAGAATAADLEVNYIVSNAGWAPQYDLRAIDIKSPVQLGYKAIVFQGTGEEWKDVRLKLSSANPNQSGLKPELLTWYLDFYQPPVPLRSSIGRVSKAAEPAARGADKQEEMALAAPAESVADYVSAIQTTLNTEFDISLPYTVSSASKPTVVDIRNYEMKATYEFSVAPKLDMNAFLIAKATGWEEFSLLPGEANIFFEGTFVGKTIIDPNNIKDTLSVSLGRDKRIVVKREKLKDLTTRKVIGVTQRESYAWEISVRNTKTEQVNIVIEDQVPVSQNSQIEITPSDLGGAKFDAMTGKLTWRLSIQPNETKKVAYSFEVKFPKGKQVPGL